MKNKLIIKDEKTGKTYMVETVRTVVEILADIHSTENDAITDKLYWIEAVLTNDENATDEELVKYFIKEGSMSEAEAKEWVAKRSEYLGKI